MPPRRLTTPSGERRSQPSSVVTCSCSSPTPSRPTPTSSLLSNLLVCPSRVLQSVTVADLVGAVQITERRSASLVDLMLPKPQLASGTMVDGQTRITVKLLRSTTPSSLTLVTSPCTSSLVEVEMAFALHTDVISIAVSLDKSSHGTSPSSWSVLLSGGCAKPAC